MKKAMVVMIVALMPLFIAFSSALSQELPGKLSKGEIIEIAIKAAEKEKIATKEAKIIYDQEHARWQERVKTVDINTIPNNGILEPEFLKQYRIVYFDFPIDASTKDVWVFVDKDIGEILAVYKEE